MALSSCPENEVQLCQLFVYKQMSEESESEYCNIICCTW